MLAARRCLDSGIPAQEQKLFFEAHGEKSAEHDLRSETIQKYVREGSIARLAESAIDGKKPFTSIAAAAARSFRARYDKKPPEVLAAHERKAEAELYAFETAAGELHFGRKAPGYSRKNPSILSRAREVMERTEFRETMDRVLQGKTAAEMCAARQDETPEKRRDRYLLAARSLWYEKRCARIATEAYLQEKGAGGLPEEKIAAA